MVAENSVQLVSKMSTISSRFIVNHLALLLKIFSAHMTSVGSQSCNLYPENLSEAINNLYNENPLAGTEPGYFTILRPT
jgi:hypothetical protein